MVKHSLILIDPLTGFCGPSGTLAKKYGENELVEIRNTIPRIVNAVTRSNRVHLVKSEYITAQYTNGNVNDPLANLCVPGINKDCVIVDELSCFKYSTCSIKHKENALSSNEFKVAIDKDLNEGVTRFFVAGFLLEHCVKATAEGLVKYIPNYAAEVVVCPDLSASRVAKHKNGDVEIINSSLNENGIKIENWNQASP